jgi:hypothetical protein
MEDTMTQGRSATFVASFRNAEEVSAFFTGRRNSKVEIVSDLKEFDEDRGRTGIQESFQYDT